jgi:hypothetical protein
VGEGEEDMIRRRDDLAGLDDLIAELALIRRALLRELADEPIVRCGRRLNHPRRPTQFGPLGYFVTDTCPCLRPAGHDRGCWCEPGFERLVYRVDDDGREHYATRPLGGL